jgi:hypothetical protein
MIINGGSRRNGAFFARHLTNAEKNERVTLCDMRNLAAETIPCALREMAAVASGTFCRNHFYHANLNPKEHEQLTERQWEIAVDTLERNLRLTGHARFVVEHRKEGRTHRHVIWSRIDVTVMRAVVMANDYEKHQTTARELEKAFALESVPSVWGRTRASGPRPSRRPETWESFRGQGSGIDPFAMKKSLTQLYRECSNGQEFASRLPEHGCVLVQGDRTDFCIRDAAGHLHSLMRRIEGVKAAALREFMRDVAVTSSDAHAGPRPLDG